SSDKSVGSSSSQIILFGTIPAEILTETPTIPSVDLYNVTVAQWRSRVAAHSSPSSSPTHDSSPSGVTPPTISRNRVRALPSGRLTSRYPSDHSLSNHFSSDDSSLDSSSDSSSDYSSDSSSGHSLPDSSIDAPITISARPSRKRYRSPAVSVQFATPVPGALSPVHADLLPPRKRIRCVVTLCDFDDSTKESYEAYTKPNIDFDVQADIDVDTTAVEATVTREADVGVEVGIRSNGEDEVESEDGCTIEFGVDRVTEPVVSDDFYEFHSDDMIESANKRG
nr:hypothetical protein [Tanacetum cinerariifolium]